MGSGRDKLWLCRAHEVEHLRPSASIENMNLQRLGAGLKADGDCWLWTGRLDPEFSRPMFDPEGSDRAEWVAYRALWDLLTGGHRHGLELDHCRCHDVRCCSPAHLEPVTRSENERRKKKPKRRVNRDAAALPAVVRFAERFSLPLPA